MYLWGLLLAAILSACVSTKPEFDLSGKKILIVIAPSNFRDEEFSEPYDILRSGGANITVASLNTTPARGMLGKVVTPNVSVSSVKGSDFDAVVFVGGTGVEQHKMFEQAEVLRVAKEAASSGKLVAAICMGPKILAAAGVLKGKKATVFSSAADFLKSNGANYTSQDLVVDGKIITSSGPQAARVFGNKIAEMLQ